MVERTYNPGVVETNERRISRSGSRKSIVNPNYLADDVIYETNRRSGEGYVSREAPRTTVREVITQQNVGGSPRMQTSGRSQYRYTSGDAMREERIEGRKSGREIEEQFFREGTEAAGIGGGSSGAHREEVKYSERVEGAGHSPRSYSSNQRLRHESKGSGNMREEMDIRVVPRGSKVRKSVKRITSNKQQYSDSEDDY